MRGVTREPAQHVEIVGQLCALWLEHAVERRIGGEVDGAVLREIHLSGRAVWTQELPRMVARRDGRAADPGGAKPLGHGAGPFAVQIPRVKVQAVTWFHAARLSVSPDPWPS